MKSIFHKIYVLTSILSSLFATSNSVMAQSIKTDGTTPTRPVSCSGDCTIEGGLQQGNNLFHSFERFNVDARATVLLRDPGVENILSRVTGNKLSEILGTLGISGGDANLFLINPNGIIFGQDSSLDINGSFLATTADAVLFGEQGLLDTAPIEIALLTIHPSALFFAQGNQGTIINESSSSVQNERTNFQTPFGLEVPDGKNLLFVGGDIIIDGGILTAFGGRIELGGLRETGEIILNNRNIDEGNISLNFPKQFKKANVYLNNASSIDTTSKSGGGGDIAINAENITILGESRLFTGTINSTTANSESGDITLNATKKIEINQGAIGNQIFSSGNSGDININANSLIVRGTNYIQTSVFGTGSAGNINIKVPDGKIEIIGNSSSKYPFINTSIDLDGVGNSGKIRIIAQEMVLNNYSRIEANNFGQGNSGDIEISAEEKLVLTSNSVISSTIEPEGIGKAANIKIEAGELNILDGSTIRVNAEGIGEAGSLEIQAQDIELDSGGLTAETQTGDEGNITLNNADTLLLNNNSQITTNATQSATGGDISISSDGIALLDDSDITANAVRGQGGNIQITTQGIFREPNSEITAASQLGIDGTVTFNTPDVDPTSGMIELPVVPLDAETILAQNLCKLDDEEIAKGSSFIITGMGGLTPTSEGSLGNRDRLVDWATRDDLEVSDNGTVGIRQRAKDSADKSYPDIQQSQGLVVAADGSTWLTANAPSTVPQNSKTLHPDCNTSE